MVKYPPANTEDIRDAGSIPRLRRCPGEGNGNPFQNSCLANPMDRGAWWATVHGVAKSRTWLSDFTHKNTYFVAQITPTVPWKALSVDLHVFSNNPYIVNFFWEFSCYLALQDVLELSCIFPTPETRIISFYKKHWFLSLENAFRDKDLGTRCIIICAHV